MYRIVLDTSVVVSGFRSRRGASFDLLSLLPSPAIEIQISVPLAIEYESVLKRRVHRDDFGPREAEEAVNAFCRIAAKHEIHFLWRPFLPDAGDDFILELAVKSNCDFIVTHNIRHFNGSKSFGIGAITPGAFMKLLEAGI